MIGRWDADEETEVDGMSQLGMHQSWELKVLQSSLSGSNGGGVGGLVGSPTAGKLEVTGGETDPSSPFIRGFMEWLLVPQALCCLGIEVT